MVSIQSRSQNYPFIDELKDCLDASDAYEVLKDHPWSFFLDSGVNSHAESVKRRWTKRRSLWRR